MNSLFQQKQRELVVAVSKVEELTRQLEMLKNGRIDGFHDNQSAVAELDRLYKELQVEADLLCKWLKWLKGAGHILLQPLPIRVRILQSVDILVFAICLDTYL